MKNIILQMKWILRSVLLVLLLSFSVLSTWANPVDIRQAQEVAAKFAKTNLNQRLTTIDRILLAKVYSMSNGRSGCYVFNLNPGFVIVAADDCAIPILGYSEDSQLDSDHIPIQMDVYIRGFVKQLQYGIEKGVEADTNIAAQWVSVRQTGYINGQKADRSLGPLLSTQWNQICYYNNKCPEDSNGDCGHVAVGCVATAMGQVLRYWEYPTTGQGTHSYTPDGYATQTVNYGATTYNWSNMPNRLVSSSSSTQINAVSTLLWHCGVGVEMKYGAESSWAYFDDVITALQDHFRFPSGMFADWRTDDDTWLALLKGCLNHNCPVYYTAQDDNGNGGHAFVCDGYDSNNYFHFNWGWSGEGDGYFALSALNLFGMEFNTDHYAIFNMAPDPIVLQQNVSASPSNGGSVSGSGSYYFGNTCTLNATANTGYSFVCWKKNGIQISTNPTYRFRVVDSDSYVAVFSPNSCTISASANPTASGIVSGGGSYNYGSTCTLTATPATGYSFVRWTKNGNQVSTNTSYSFTVTENATYVAVFEQSTVTHSQSLTNGWNWWSSYVELNGTDGLTLLENSLGSAGQMIKSRSDGYVESYQYNGTTGWFGSLTSINNEEMYKINMSAGYNAAVTGYLTSATSHPITITNGWNWIGFPLNYSVGVTEALSSFSPAVNDVLKGRNGFTTYYSYNGTTGWFGSLNTLEPGNGYMYQSQSSGTKTLVFQTSRSEATMANITPENNVYRPEDKSFADNMTVTAVVEREGEELRSESHELAAFAGGECRGSVRLLYVEPIDRYVAFLTVFGELGDELEFRLTDGMETQVSADRLTFIPDGIAGTLASPKVLHFGALDVAETSAMVRIYPNPVRTKGTLNIALPDASGMLMVEISNMLGQTVLKTEVVLDPTSAARIMLPQTVLPGTYVLKATHRDGTVYYGKLVVE